MKLQLYLFRTEVHTIRTLAQSEFAGRLKAVELLKQLHLDKFLPEDLELVEVLPSSASPQQDAHPNLEQ